MKLKTIVVICLMSAIIVLDQFTKWYALAHWREEHIVNPFLSFQVTFNRGISWGILNYSHGGVFLAVTLGILLIIACLLVYVYKRSQQGKSIVGEVLVIGGAFSNSLDRLMHEGVVDFIVLHKDSWVWPSFNIADSCIVLGVLIMFMHAFVYHD